MILIKKLKPEQYSRLTMRAALPILEFCHGAWNAPFISQAFRDHAWTHPGFSSPLSLCLRFPKGGQPNNGCSVRVLDFQCGPSDIAGFIVSVGILTIQRVSRRWPQTQRREELFERSETKLNPATAVLLEILIMRVSASIFRPTIRSIFRRPTRNHATGDCSTKATTRISIPALQNATGKHFGNTTIAEAFPKINIARWVFASKSSHHQAAKALPPKINKTMTKRDWFEGLKKTGRVLSSHFNLLERLIW